MLGKHVVIVEEVRQAGDKPTFFNLLQIQLPVGALTSILHRITGVLLAVAIPFGVFLLDRSLQGPQAYAAVSALLDGWALRTIMVAVIWALSHHLLAGLRHLLMDIASGREPVGIRSLP